MSDREWRFKKRITVEREILSTVNDAFALSEPLVGLTGPAIAVWQDKVATAYGENTVAVVKSVLEASTRLSLDTDNSRDVFSDDVLMSPTTIEDAITRVKHDVMAFMGAIGSH